MKVVRLPSCRAGKPPIHPRFIGVALLLISCSFASAATRTWLNTNGGLWRNAANWSGGVVPDSNDTVIINADGTYTVTVEQTAQFASLTLGGGTGTPTLNWTGGILPGNIAIQSGAVLRYGITGFNSLLDSGTIQNSGTIRWAADAAQPWSLSSANIINQAGGLIELERDGSFNRHTGNPFILNHGTIRKVGGTLPFGATDFNAGVAFTNRGTVQVQQGNISFGDGFVSSANFELSAGTQLNLHGGTFHLEPGHQVTGAGSYGIFQGGSPVIDGPIIHPDFRVDSGVFTMTNEIQGGLTWSGGTLAGEITVKPAGTLTYNITGFNSLQTAAIINEGTILWATNAPQPWSLSSGSIVNQAGGLIDLERDGSFNRHTGSPFILNHGIIRKRGSTPPFGSTDFNAGVAFTNRGTVQVQQGNISFGDGFVSSANFELSAGTQLNLHGGTFHLEPGHQVTGAGSYGIFQGGSPVINGPIIHPDFRVDSGVFTMTNEIRGGLTWSGGTLAGEITVKPAGTLTYNITGFNSLQTAAIINEGTVLWATNAIQPWSLSSGSIVNQAGGLIDLERDGSFNRHTGNPFILNHGTIRKRGSTPPFGSTDFNQGLAFTNTGTIEALAGRMTFGNGYEMTGGVLKFGIAGNSEFGQIEVTGDAPLVGGVSAMLLNGFVPATNVDFQVMTFGSRSGTFADTSGLSVGSGRAFQPLYTATTLTLRSFAVDDVVISQQPQALTVVAGSPAEFNVTASGTGQLTYQWRHNGNPLPNTDTNRLVIPNVQLGNAGNYDVVVTSSAGSSTSAAAALVVHIPPMLSLPPVSQQVANGQNATFTVAATGTPAPGYQWLFNGNPIAGATGPQLTINNAMAGEVGAYSVIVSNAAGAVTNTVTLTLVDLKMFAGIIIDGEINSQFRVEFTTDVNTPTTNWTSLGTITLTQRPTFFFDIDSPDQPHRFYRAMPLP